MAGVKRPREADDLGGRPRKLPTPSNAHDEFDSTLLLDHATAKQPEPEPVPVSTLTLDSHVTTRSKLPSALGNKNGRAPLTTNAVNTNVTTRKKRRSASAPKELRPAPSGIIRGQRTVHDPDPSAGTQRATRSRTVKAAGNDERWARFEAERNAGTNLGHSNRGRIGVEMQEELAKVSALQSAQVALQTELRETRNQELQHRRGLLAANDELTELKRRHERQIQEMEERIKQLEREHRDAKADCRLLQNDLKMERETSSSIKTTLSQHTNAHMSLQAQLDASQRLVKSLQLEAEKGLGSVSEMQFKLQAALERNKYLEAEALVNEQIRRKLHNQIQELKGNIRVYVRVRPIVKGEKDEARGTAAIAFPDTREHQEIVLTSSSESATGNQRQEIVSFNFDRVFEPQTSQMEMFEEVSQLVQSVTDGYNVTIFAYGQTGSGKSYTMEGGSTEVTQGMIPRAVQQLFQTGDSMRSKGWEYTMEGQFLEIYNETINDLLGQGEFDNRKHEIKHDKSGRTTVTDVVAIPLSSPSQVAILLGRAQSRRSVASTLMNQRSSRSHSVFTLRVSGTNNITGETCEGCLNLVDLAGSERLSSSGAANDKERLRETQAINKSLSSLGDVIAALGVAGDNKDKTVHIPYRNSKLTYLLQNSLGGNSKTLMILNLSPMAAHYGESLCSLRFATKVNNTTIGKATAKKGAATS